MITHVLSGGLTQRLPAPEPRAQAQFGWYAGSAGAVSRLSVLSTNCCTTGSFGVWSCSIGSSGHLFWIVMLVTCRAEPASAWLVYGVTTSSCVVEMTV